MREHEYERDIPDVRAQFRDTGEPARYRGERFGPADRRYPGGRPGYDDDEREGYGRYGRSPWGTGEETYELEAGHDYGRERHVRDDRASESYEQLRGAGTGRAGYARRSVDAVGVAGQPAGGYPRGGRGSLQGDRTGGVHDWPYSGPDLERYGRDETQGRFSGRGPKGYQRSRDRIMEDVCERLTHHPEIDASGIEVEVQQDVVVLRGSVQDRQQKRMAEDVAESVSGVRDVRNEIEPERGMIQALTDAIMGRDDEDKAADSEGNRRPPQRARR